MTKLRPGQILPPAKKLTRETLRENPLLAGLIRARLRELAGIRREDGKAKTMRTLTPEPLTASAFAPFGRVIEFTDDAVKIDINQGHAVRYDALAEIDVGDEGGVGVISLFRAQPLAPPVTPAQPLASSVTPAHAGAQAESKPALVLKTFERHPLGSQSFIPLNGKPYLVAVAPAGEFDVSKVRLFRAEGHQGVHYHKGTWHHFLLVLGADSDFLVVDRAGPGENCEEVELETGEQIRVRR